MTDPIPSVTRATPALSPGRDSYTHGPFGRACLICEEALLDMGLDSGKCMHRDLEWHKALAVERSRIYAELRAAEEAGE